MDKLVNKIVALGVPGLVLLIVISTTGYVGAVAITATLALLGGPFGMLGGLAALGFMVLIANGISKFGFERIFIAVVKNLYDKGESIESIRDKIKKYPLSKELKATLLATLEKYRK
ncbi:MAG: hypothetical protein K8S56_02565 [Candidatus Cloacimonetes bacterium]|nr:hypothetical protein [Candidatus Cloacimonadota bacterium]